MKLKLLFLFSFSFFIGLVNHAKNSDGRLKTSMCTVNIPDANFKSALISNSSINTNNNTEIECTEASNYTGSVIVSNMGVSDLTGIEAFVNTSVLSLPNNNISTLDISANTALTELILTGNPVTSLNTSNNILLERLSLNNTDLTALSITNLTNLEVLAISNTDITALDTSTNINLEKFAAFNNKFTSLDLSNNAQVDFISLGGTNSTIEQLNIANGNNNNIVTFNANNAFNLTCIQIDNGFSPPTNGSWQKEANATYSTNCFTLNTEKFEINNFKIYPNPTTSILNIESLQSINLVEVYAITGKFLKSLRNTNSVDVSNLKSGVYFIKITSNSGSVTKRFLKQ